MFKIENQQDYEILKIQIEWLENHKDDIVNIIFAESGNLINKWQQK